MYNKDMAKTPDNNGKSYKRNKIDPRAVMFKRFYVDPQSHTFMNALQSALRAGYSEHYASNITHLKPKWFKDILNDSDVKRAEMLKDSEDHFSTMLKKDTNRIDKDTLKIKHDSAKFVSETVGKDIYSKRQELTDKGGKRLFNTRHRQEAQKSLEDLFAGVAPAPVASNTDESADGDED